MNTSDFSSPTVDSREPASHPPIRSFVHRRGHITRGQAQALAQWLAHWSIPYQKAPIDPARVFGRTAPLILEIGFGMGETTQQIAQARPEQDFLGIEVFSAGVGALLKRIEAHQISNIRIVQHDAVEVLEHMIAPHSLAGIHIFFPDPWPKTRHHKRRLIQPPFVELLCSRMAPGSYLHCATDWAPYAQQMLEVLGNQPLLRNSYEGFAPRPAHRPRTKFEARGLRLGHRVHDLIFTREPSSGAAPSSNSARTGKPSHESEHPTERETHPA